VIGLDTNLLVRLYVQDDAEQARSALRALREAAPVFVPKSVVLELFWVLTSVYELPRARLSEVLRHLASLDELRVEDDEAVSTAISYYQRGIDFADALHLASARGCERFLTFDRALAARAARLGLSPACERPQA
jgi:predicted nucleic-acid-binding protein